MSAGCHRCVKPIGYDGGIQLKQVVIYKQECIKVFLIYRSLITTLPLLVFAASQANAQLIPQPWVSVGARNSSVTYSVGAKFIGVGAELGTGPKGATGVDVLKFVNLPFFSPYVGIGVYSGDKTVAYSGGVQVSASSNFFLGVGYNSVRGVNGQIGIKF